MIQKIQGQLAWRGTKGKVRDNIVILRRDAEALVEDYEELRKAYLALTSENNNQLCTYGPEEERKPHWILKFEDADKGDMHFDDGAEAMKMFAICNMTWNCTLYVTARFKPIQITFTVERRD
jgi:hypothetical protein